MKRMFCASLLLGMLLCVAMTVLADVPLCGYDSASGYRYVSLGSFPQAEDGACAPILWRVLSVEDGEAYLLSEYILFNNRIHPDDDAYASWQGAFNQTEMFTLLNGPFEGNPLPLDEQERLKKIWRIGRVHIAKTSFLEEAFTAQERAMLISDEALGAVFLASAEDLKNADYGFASDQSRKAYGTAYALANGLFRYGNGSSPYWTRSQSSSFPYGTRCTKVDGRLGYIRCVVMNEGCRPAVRLRMDGLEVTGGSGTMSAPWTLALSKTLTSSDGLSESPELFKASASLAY